MQKTLIYILFIFSQTLFSSTKAIAQAPYIITTVAGDSLRGYCCDGDNAIDAELNAPLGVFVDSFGNIYIADTYNNVIRKVDTLGIIHTIAGTGFVGFSGDNGFATNATMRRPVGIVVDKFENIYFVDCENNRVRKIDTSGIITTIAGTGSIGYNGDGIQATTAELYNPTGIAIDDTGNLYITDAQNFRIRKVNTNGIITTIAGNGTVGNNGDNGPATAAEMNYPYGIAIDRNDNIYFADAYANVIRKTNNNGIITAIAGNDTIGFAGDNGPATLAKLSNPCGITIDYIGNVYIGDSYNNRIRVVNTHGIINTFVGTGMPKYNDDNIPTDSANLQPFLLCIGNDNNLFIADFYNSRIRKINIPLELHEITNQSNEMKIFPNPNTGKFSIFYPRIANEPVEFTILNIYGQMIKEKIATTNEKIEISLETAPGLYFIQAKTNTQTITQKIIIN